MTKSKKNKKYIEKTSLEIELINAAYKNDIKKIMVLIKQGVDINTLEYGTKNNSLMIAATYGYKELVTILLNFSNIDINACQNVGYTSLMLAAQEQHNYIIEVLLAIPYIDVDHRSVTMQDFQGKTYNAMDLYLHACKQKTEKPNQKIINLFENASYINKKIKEYTKGGKERVLIKAIEQNDLEMVMAILASPRTIVDVNQRSRAGDTALMVAMKDAKNNPTRLAIVEALLSVPTINLEIKNTRGQTAIDLFNILQNTAPSGGMNGNARKIKELHNKLTQAYNVSEIIKMYPKDQYILISAIKNQNLNVIQTTLDSSKKININLIMDNEGNSALTLAEKIGNLDIIQAINDSILAENQTEDAELEDHEDLDAYSVSSTGSHISIRSQSPVMTYYTTSIATSSRDFIDHSEEKCATLIDDENSHAEESNSKEKECAKICSNSSNGVTLARTEETSPIRANNMMLPPKKRPRLIAS